MRFDLQLFAEERREPATPRRREEARRRGQIWRSVEVSSVASLIALLAVFSLWGGGAAGRLASYAASVLSEMPAGDWGSAEVIELLRRAGVEVLLLIAPFFAAACLGGAGASLAQVGFRLNGVGLLPRWERIDPLQGLRRIFSLRSAVELGKALVKLAAVGTVVGLALSGAASRFPELLFATPLRAALVVGGWLGQLAWATAAALVLVALGDVLWQRWDYERQLRMSHEELKRELRETEGDPQLRAQRRRRQRELSRNRMLADVARADVVITNPTHVAVALRYDEREMAAPLVVAKGRGFLAERIRQRAREHGVALIENPPLARSLYGAARVGEAVPEAFYRAVAEVLAFVWRARRRASGEAWESEGL